jgi:threonine dehydrogenase-like Zn-dependent dehydrogenase
VTDIDQARLDRAATYFTAADARRHGVELHYVNTRNVDAVATLKALTGGRGFDDVFAFAPVTALVEDGARLLGFNGCLNFFAGPSDNTFSAKINFYDIHYSGHHFVGSSGGNTDDMKEALRLMADGALNPSVLITHVGGLDAAAGTIKELPHIPGGKKLIYTRISMPLVALADFDQLGRKDPVFRELARITAASNGLWSVEAEEYLLAHAKPIRAA